ncbi:putative 3-hydroxyphenylpropionic transporter MhpT [Cedecea lapagei]|uniref:Putative 3-hydroxyphenylpropionic transporter MhpT n=1 Tax=Cedecea lapagei TaxID=158823 RepID=A0A3S5DPE9_9ENTR|nr:MFS transporter [Cedecea lapagei]VEB94992.1 putative 3-hydroxyphenylpropionic transporter MhpT [Cedecea lapagei]
MKPFYTLCIGRVGASFGTMAYAGALPVIRAEWHLDASSAGAIQTAFNIANALGLFSTSWLCDYFGAKRVYLMFSWLAVAALFLFAYAAHSYTSAMVIIILVGLTQGGAYTPSMLLALKMSSIHKRGYSVGMILTAGSLGYLLSLFIASWGSAFKNVSFAFYLCSLGVLAGALLSSLALYHYKEELCETTCTLKKTDNSRFKLTALLLLVGYIAHCWELLGSWAWTPSMIAHALVNENFSPLTTGLIITFTIHLSGMLSTLLVGSISDYFNRTAVLIFMGAGGAISSVLMGMSVSWGAAWSIALAFLGSFFILGDSGVLSAAIADNVPAEKIGKVMGVRSLLGFGCGSFSPFLFGMALDASNSWWLAYSVLGLGGIIACFSAILLKRSERAVA